MEQRTELGALGLFPQMVGRSAFNARVRWLWGAFIHLQHVVGAWLSSTEDLYECVDSVPLPAFSYGQSCREKGHWLWESTLGYGGTTGEFYLGDQVLVSVTPSGAITGWLVGNANIDERWLLTVFLSARAGQPHLQPPPHSSHRRQDLCPPVGHMGAVVAVGSPSPRPYLADRGFNSSRWQHHWLQYGATVITIPQPTDAQRGRWSRQDCLWLASHRQIIETTFAFLGEVFAWQRLNAHSRWGQYTRLAATFAAYQIGLWLNRSLGRPLHALATLIL